ncbi:MAG: hypothetical protein A3G01_02015 [Candidatus Kerfeldbacteria bacterium RIFCSPLOWO2_12_FULL_43_9]|nr:MAG: hypothetical protein A3G01_02015 [Candidatus Kerfeldbacteria bacterium RIFCSPLOWO2_12_FULL_43_9]
MHIPGLEHEQVPPSERERYLIEDILSVPEAEEQMKIFQTILVQNGVEVLNFKRMLSESLCDDNLKAACLESLQIERRSISVLIRNNPQVLSGILIGETGMLPPLPNLMFQRDIGAVVGDRILCCSPKFQVRFREALLFKHIVNHHPIFQGVKVEKNDQEAGALLEGGDICVVSKDIVILGYGHRSSEATMKKSAYMLMKSGIKTVIVVPLTDRREHMHLDTVFTVISHNECLVYAPVIFGSQRLGLEPLRLQVYHQSEEPGLTDNDLPNVIGKYGTQLQSVLCGGGDGDSLIADQEQWADATNALAIRPGQIVKYIRNRRTLEALSAQGYRIHSIQSLADAKRVKPEAGKVVYAIIGTELGKARGGPRCMTLPLLRDEI